MQAQFYCIKLQDLKHIPPNLSVDRGYGRYVPGVIDFPLKPKYSWRCLQFIVDSIKAWDAAPSVRCLALEGGMWILGDPATHCSRQHPMSLGYLTKTDDLWLACRPRAFAHFSGSYATVNITTNGNKQLTAGTQQTFSLLDSQPNLVLTGVNTNNLFLLTEIALNSA